MSKTYNITLFDGDGIGPEITKAVVEIIDYVSNRLDFKINWDLKLLGQRALEECGEVLPSSSVESLEKNRVALKAPVTTPIGYGFSSVNVQLRRHFNLFANVRPSKNLAGINTPFSNVDLVIVRENTEDIYAGIEEKIDKDTIHGIKVITRHASENICDFAFRYALSHDRKEVSVATKANISKLADGLFLNTFREVSKKYPSIKTREILIDNLCMQLVQNPSQFDVLVMPNLYGDIVSDLCAGLVGGLGIAQSANMGIYKGENIALFEAVHGSAPDIQGKNIANPTGLLRSGILMLEYLNEKQAAKMIEGGLFETLKQGRVLTKDLGGCASTSEFKDAIKANIKI